MPATESTMLDDPIAALKAAAHAAALIPTSMLPTAGTSNATASASTPRTRTRHFARTKSMPSLQIADVMESCSAIQQRACTSKASTSFSTHSSKSGEPRNHASPAMSSARSSCSNGSSMSSSRRRLGALDISDRHCGTGDSSDDSDDEQRNIRLRLGGCRPNSEALPKRDDCNKENVAPLRSLSQQSLQIEESTRQEDDMARRTRTTVPAPMSDRSGSVRSSATTSALRRRHFARTVSSPASTSMTATTRQKRGRVSDASLLEVDSSNECLPSPTSRVRLETSGDETDSCYFSSHGTSLFEPTSSQELSPAHSRCTTPDLSSSPLSLKKIEDIECDGYDSDAETTMAIDDDDVASLSSLPGGSRDYANIFVHARSLLRYGAGSEGQVIGREREKSTLHRFLQRRLGLFQHMEHSATPAGDAFAGALDLDGASESGSLYICGMPGTGKTALVKSILGDVLQQQSPSISSSPRVAFIDCMTVQHPRELFRSVLVALQEDVTDLPTGDQGQQEAERRVNEIVTNQDRKLLIVLDEIDHLMRSRVHQNILYQLFSWPAKSDSCSLIGIANSLDLTERFVPLLASKGAAPAVLNFRPFEAQEIMRVLNARLALLRPCYGSNDGDAIGDTALADDMPSQVPEETVLPLFAPAALELLARKVSAATGDLRKALDGARLAVEAVETEYNRKCKSSDLPASATLTPSTAPKASPAHILRILTAVLGSPQLTKLRTLGLQAKLVLLAYLVAHKRSGYGLPVLGGNGASHSLNKKGSGAQGSLSNVNASAVALDDVETTYTAMLKNDEFATLESSEFMGVLEGLEVEGVVRFTTIGAALPGRPSSKPVVARPVLGVFGSNGKRGQRSAAQKQTKGMVLSMSHEEVLRGITTAAPAARSTSSNTTTSCSPVVAAAVQRIWLREEHNAERAKGWEAQAALSARVRNDELGGGRGAHGI